MKLYYNITLNICLSPQSMEKELCLSTAVVVREEIPLVAMLLRLVLQFTH